MNTERRKKAWGQVIENQPMKDLTSFKIGGPVDLFIQPNSIEELKNCIQDLKAQAYPWMVMGLGSNMLVSDRGIRGAVIKLGPAFAKIQPSQDQVRAGSGASLKDVAQVALDQGLAGLEFAHGIPGSVGGAMTMNAGAYGGEMAQVVVQVVAMDQEGRIKTYRGDEMNFAYRHSRVQEEGLIVLEALYQLRPADKKAIREKMEDLWNRRLEKQPLEYPSAGSTFKRPPGHYAGQLIDQAGLRGLRHGGAQVSEKHCGFVINTGQATCQDVVELIKMVQEAVLLEHGVKLETEVKVIGD